MNKIITIFARTPWWVWILFGLLLYRGIKALKPSVISLYTLFILPGIFIALSLQSLLSTKAITFWIVSIWFGALVIGSLCGWFIVGKAPIKADKKNRWIWLPGTKLTLILIPLIFGIRYYFGYSIAINPQLMYSIPFLTTRFTLGGLMSGLFIGRSLCFLYKYQKAEHRNLAAR